MDLSSLIRTKNKQTKKPGDLPTMSFVLLSPSCNQLVIPRGIDLPSFSSIASSRSFKFIKQYAQNAKFALLILSSRYSCQNLINRVDVIEFGWKRKPKLQKKRKISVSLMTN